MRTPCDAASWASPPRLSRPKLAETSPSRARATASSCKDTPPLAFRFRSVAASICAEPAMFRSPERARRSRLPVRLVTTPPSARRSPLKLRSDPAITCPSPSETAPALIVSDPSVAISWPSPLIEPARRLRSSSVAMVPLAKVRLPTSRLSASGARTAPPFSASPSTAIRAEGAVMAASCPST